MPMQQLKLAQTAMVREMAALAMLGQAIPQQRRSCSRTRQGLPRLDTLFRDIGCPRSGRPSFASAKTRAGRLNYCR